MGDLTTEDWILHAHDEDEQQRLIRTRRHVTLIVAEHAHNQADLRMLLDMLGLITEEDP